MRGTGSIRGVRLIFICGLLQFEFGIDLSAATNLPSAFLTKAPGFHALQPPWVGEARITFTTRQDPIYANPGVGRAIERADKELRFESFLIGDSDRSIQIQQIVHFPDGDGAAFYQWRSALPIDSAITNAVDRKELFNTLGMPDPRMDPLDQVVWRLFTIVKSNRMETLTVFHNPDSRTDFVIRRGTLQQEATDHSKSNLNAVAGQTRATK